MIDLDFLVTILIGVLSPMIALIAIILNNRHFADSGRDENTRAITELTVTLKHFIVDFDALEKKNHDSHARIHQKNDDQDLMLENHEQRISHIEEEINRDEK